MIKLQPTTITNFTEMLAVPVIFNRIALHNSTPGYLWKALQVYLLADHLCQIADNSIYQIKTGQL